MRKLLVAAILFFGCHCLAQCPFAVTLQNKGSFCLGKDTLLVASANKLASIKWYKNGVVDTVVNSVVNSYSKNGVTVAGGNGLGTALNQVTSRSVFVLPDGSFYVNDFTKSCAMLFPAGSNSTTFGTIVAGGNNGGTAANQLQDPYDVIIDANGFIYISDSYNFRVQRFPPNSNKTTNGTTVAGVNGQGNAANQLGPVASIFLDASGNLYVADQTNNRIQKFPPNSTSATNGVTIAGGNGKGAASNQLNQPTGIVIDANGNLLVADAGNNRVQAFPPNSTNLSNGVTVAGGNGFGSAANQLFDPVSVCLDKMGNIFVTDYFNNRIQKFPVGSTINTDGVTVAGGIVGGPGPAQLSFPEAVFVDNSGNVFVSDASNHRIQKFTPSSMLAIDTTRIPTTPGTYYAVVTDTTGCTVTTNSITISAPVTPTINIATTSSASACSVSNTISFKATTTNSGASPKFQWMVNNVNAGTGDSTFIGTLANGDVVNCVLFSNAVCAAPLNTLSNSYIVKLGAPPVANLYLKGGLCLGGDTLVVSSPGVIASIAWYNGNVLDTLVKAVFKAGINPNGLTVAGGNGQGSAANQFYNPNSIYVDGGGNIYVADYYNNRIQKFPSGSTVNTNGVTVAGGNGSGSAANQLWYPNSVFVDANGYLYVSDRVNNRIQKFPPGSTAATNGITVAGGNGFGPAANQLNGPTSVFVDGVGNIYVSELGNNRVQKFSSGSTSATNGTTVAGSNIGGGSAANQLYYPNAVFVDNLGNVFIADEGNNRIQKFPSNSNSATNGVTVAGGNGMGAAANQLNAPSSVFVDASGNVYVTDFANNRIQQFPSGSTGATNGVTIAGGVASSQLKNPISISVDAKGNIYVCDYGNNRIQKFSSYPPIIDTTFIPTTSGTYTAVITDTSGCTFTTNAITINPTIKPTVNISADKTSLCAGNVLLFTATPTNVISPASYKWQVNGNAVGTNSANYSSSILANGDAVTCIISNGGGCIGTDTSNIIIANVKPSPTVGPAADISITLGQSVVLNMPVTGNIASYLWSPSSTLSNDTILDPTATPLKTTTYTLKVVSVDSCSASGTITVNVSSNIYFTSGFTPNGDGRNDVFYVLGGLAGDKIKDFSIFDRWGKRLFEAQNILPNDISVGWDGRFNGEIQQQGSYVYVVTIVSTSGKETVHKGTVMLVR